MLAVAGTYNNGKYDWMTYTEWQLQVDRLEGVLNDSHVKQGDRVGLICKNRLVESLVAPFYPAYTLLRVKSSSVALHDSLLPQLIRIQLSCQCYVGLQMGMGCDCLCCVSSWRHGCTYVRVSAC
jgi:acyl-CoA synthetase (AMP-forming)/AMP-acid ligase II